MTSESSTNSGRKAFWRSLEEKESPARLQEEAKGSDIVKQTIDAGDLTRLRRRHFLTLSGAISTLAGIEGCIRRPVEKIMPYAEMPEDVTVGVPLHYASVLRTRGESLGVIVQAYEGRPTKIEGNADHAASLGTTDLLTQASLLDLYDADRARAPMQKGGEKTYAELDEALGKLAKELAAGGGRGVHVLSEPISSPTVLRMRAALQQKLPQARFHTYAPFNDSNERAGTKLAFGKALVVDNRYRAAKVIVALDSDFLMTEAGSVLANQGFSAGRHMRSAADREPNRLYVVEPTMTVTGSNADHRLTLPAGSIAAYAKALAASLGKNGISLGAIGAAVGNAELAGVPAHWLNAVARDLVAHKGESLVVVGSGQPAAVHALAQTINIALGNAGKTVGYITPIDDEPEQFGDIASLAQAMAAGQVQTLVILGGNPVYDAPADTKFKAALAKVPTSLCVSTHRDETAAACTWHIPRAHALESWGDQLSRTGIYAVQQPLIAPLFGGRTDAEVLATLAGESETDPHALVKATAAARGAADEPAWQALVQQGVSERNDAQVLGVQPVQEPQIAAELNKLTAPQAPSADSLEVVFLADNKLHDGSRANNVWLLELPDPITRVVWDNVALIAPSTAKALGVENGDMVRLSAGGASIDIAAWRQPGQAAGSIGLALGWGRTAAGSHGNGVGFDAYPLRTSASPRFATGVKLQKLGSKYKISQTQDHDAMEGRPIAIDATLEEYKSEPDFTQWKIPDPKVLPLWERRDYSNGHQWGMTIDLNRCTGCSACVIACQAENNIPVVGKEQVSRGREMHWLRIDRYYIGDDDSPEVAFQPIGCQHCEEAPCENVCPVNATSHSPEGLNDIAYNRCIGTRYCMNNCPYKVRRFNFLNFNLDIPEPQKLMYNPNVTMRFRGVIEKCTYCVQRIQGAKIAAKRESRELKDGDIVSACQQACPAEAITFGDINDPNSAVSNARDVDRNYGLLADVGTRPRTRFLGKIRNPNPEMKG
jgi:molybdopterin-containing oxidoreductase family iron-sulfur binding subunit